MTNRHAVKILPPLLDEKNKQTNDDSKKCYSFDESGSDDHVRTDIAYSFRLAGNGFESASPDLTDTATAPSKG